MLTSRNSTDSDREKNAQPNKGQSAFLQLWGWLETPQLTIMKRARIEEIILGYLMVANWYGLSIQELTPWDAWSDFGRQCLARSWKSCNSRWDWTGRASKYIVFLNFAFFKILVFIWSSKKRIACARKELLNFHCFLKNSSERYYVFNLIKESYLST